MLHAQQRALTFYLIVSSEAVPNMHDSTRLGPYCTERKKEMFDFPGDEPPIGQGLSGKAPSCFVGCCRLVIARWDNTGVRRIYVAWGCPQSKIPNPQVIWWFPYDGWLWMPPQPGFPIEHDYKWVGCLVCM